MLQSILFHYVIPYTYLYINTTYIFTIYIQIEIIMLPLIYTQSQA